MKPLDFLLSPSPKTLIVEEFFKFTLRCGLHDRCQIIRNHNDSQWARLKIRIGTLQNQIGRSSLFVSPISENFKLPYAVE